MGRDSRAAPLLAVLAAASLGLGLAAGAGAHARDKDTLARARHPALKLRKPLPSVVRIGQRVTVAGKLGRAPRRARVELEWTYSTAWSVVASSRLSSHGRFRLHWRVPADAHYGSVELRMVATRHGAVLVISPAAHSFVGQAVSYCAKPTPPGNVPAGDGWIVGGLYVRGGAYPGIDACAGHAYTITATRSSGAVAARQTVPAKHSYTLVVPAGSYTLSSGPCHGSATVSAGKQTDANTDCLVP